MKICHFSWARYHFAYFALIPPATPRGPRLNAPDALHRDGSEAQASPRPSQ
jgi:hypothetical protein